MEIRFHMKEIYQYDVHFEDYSKKVQNKEDIINIFRYLTESKYAIIAKVQSTELFKITNRTSRSGTVLELSAEIIKLNTREKIDIRGLQRGICFCGLEMKTTSSLVNLKELRDNIEQYFYRFTDQNRPSKVF
jgi:hypothetical protein